MEESYWHKAWDENNIGFHLEDINPTLLKFGNKMSKNDNVKAFLPLCGKTLDLLWFSENVEHVYGVELSEKAILEFFTENQLEYKLKEEEDFKIYTSKNISIYCGDFFNFPIQELGINAIFDRGAMVALPRDMRKRYCEKMCEELKSGTNWLLSVFDYDQDKMEGPPFSISKSELDENLAQNFENTLLDEDFFKDFKVDNFKIKTYFLTN